MSSTTSSMSSTLMYHSDRACAPAEQCSPPPSSSHSGPSTGPDSFVLGLAPAQPSRMNDEPSDKAGVTLPCDLQSLSGSSVRRAGSSAIGWRRARCRWVWRRSFLAAGQAKVRRVYRKEDAAAIGVGSGGGGGGGSGDRARKRWPRNARGGTGFTPPPELTLRFRDCATEDLTAVRACWASQVYRVSLLLLSLERWRSLRSVRSRDDFDGVDHSCSGIGVLSAR